MHCPGLINPHVNLVLSVVLNIIVIVFFFYAGHSDPGVVIAKACLFFSVVVLAFLLPITTCGVQCLVQVRAETFREARCSQLETASSLSPCPMKMLLGS